MTDDPRFDIIRTAIKGCGGFDADRDTERLIRKALKALKQIQTELEAAKDAA